MASRRLTLCFLAVSLLCLGCPSGDSPTEPGLPPRPPDPAGTPWPLPAGFRMIGEAASTERDGTSVSCTLDFLFELDETPRQLAGVLEYDGVHGGSLSRTVLDARGNGLSLWPDVHGVVVVRSIAPSQLQIDFPGNVGAEGRFWRELSVLYGSFDSEGEASGTWTCAPFDIDSGGYTDTKYTATGTWKILPMS